MFQACLNKVVESCDGAVGAVVMGFDGDVVDSVSADSAFDIETLGSEFSFVLSQVLTAAEILKVGALEEVTIRSEAVTLLVRPLSEERFVAIALQPSGNWSKGRFLLRQALPELRAQR